MRRKIVYVGLLLMVLSVVLFVAISSSPVSIPHGQQLTENMTVPVLGYKAVQIIENGTSSIAFYVASSSDSNVFLFNQSAFSAWNKSISSQPYNGLGLATSLESLGALVIYGGTPTALVPPVSSYAPLYTSNVLNVSSGIVPAGVYYAVIENMNGTLVNPKAINATFVYLPAVSSSLAGRSFVRISSEGIVAILLFVVGIILAIYGALQPGPAGRAKGVPTQEEVDALYRGIGSDKYKNGGAHKSGKEKTKRQQRIS